MSFARPQYLVETDWLAQHLDDPAVRVLECTVYLVADPAEVPAGIRVESGRARSGRRATSPARASSTSRTSCPTAPVKLRFMMPPAAQFAEAMSGHGVGDGVRVVLYDRAVNMWAARIWWMLRAFGFDDAAVLERRLEEVDGREGRPVGTDAGTRPARAFTPRPRPEPDGGQGRRARRRSANGARACSTRCRRRAAPRPGGAPTGGPGRIAGSVNVVARDLVDPAPTPTCPPTCCATQFAQAGALDAKRVMTYCGGGIAASSDAFVLALLGRDDVAVYDASLSEWANDPAMPMERG